MKFNSQKQEEAYYSDQILSCIEKAFDNFGITVKLVVYHQLEKNYGVKKEDIPKNIDVFARAIDEFFGVGAQRVRVSIIYELRRSSGITELDEYDVVSAAKELHRQLQREV